MQANVLSSYSRLGASLVVMLALTACASSGSKDISKIPSQTADITRSDGAFIQPLKWEKTKEQCKGSCPKIKVDSLVFPGNQPLTTLVDASLASMTGVGDGPIHRSIADFESYFWQTAGPRDEVILAATARYRNRNLTVIELVSWQYFTGAAHGIGATQFINWDNQQASVLSLDDLLVSGRKAAFFDVLKGEHQKWLSTQDDAIEDMAQYTRLWPFQ